MNLYLIEQDLSSGYDTYDSAVVSAESEEDARKIHPSAVVTHVSGDQWMGTYSGGPNKGVEYCKDDSCSWVRFSDRGAVDVTFLGVSSVERGVVCASFNAG